MLFQLSKSFFSPLVLQTFASHLNCLTSIETIPALYTGFSSAVPCGALILAVTAVQLLNAGLYCEGTSTNVPL